MTVEFDSESLAATEEFLNRNYTTMEIGNATDGPVRSRIARDTLGGVSLDRLDLGFDMSYDADPLNKICLCGVESGWVEENYIDAGTDTFGPGEIGVLTPPELPYSGVIHQARYTITMFDPALLSRVASANRPDTGEVALSGHRTVTPETGDRLTTVISHMQQLAASYDGDVPPLVAATASQYLAATVLHAFPNTAGFEPTPVDRRDAHPLTVRRAVAYMESHIHEDIAVTDIAAAAYVTVRALQLAFRRHLDTTPTAYLKRLRLRGAHEDLITGSADDGDSVATIAAAWGFGHPGRFAALYRRHYGRSPAAVLAG
ncbi:HTH-type transcriptional activator RhaS [Nocardia cerradoensis]|uniref:HTH-type transcriptional activator RhaS n=1 Tax=Nocardia cerradoensis TaxID=85688 RepID=A0A231GY32_9NOCA|nr:helix-turn-helix transcriptional regulator [Nocardia cerradoensis]OXR41485.1 HTH-type transcriptional activator RhaS [Nocardia cerradoensis]